MPSRMPAIRFTEARHAHFIVICRCFLAHTNGVSKLRAQLRLRITFSFALPLRNGKIVPVVQLAAHAKSSTLYGRSYSRTS